MGGSSSSLMPTLNPFKGLSRMASREANREITSKIKNQKKTNSVTTKSEISDETANPEKKNGVNHINPKGNNRETSGGSRKKNKNLKIKKISSQ